MSKPRIVIVGAGPAGVRIAESLVDAGLRPVVVDESPQAGGQIYQRVPGGFRRSARTLYGFEANKATALHSAFDRIRQHIDYRPRSLAWNVRDKVLYCTRDGVHEKIPFDFLVLAVGATDRTLPIPGWTLPGVFTLGGAQKALKFQGCAIGKRVMLVGSTPLLYLVAHQYVCAGANVVAIADTAAFSRKLTSFAYLLNDISALSKGLYYMGALRARGVKIHHGIENPEINGAAGVSGFSFVDRKGRTLEYECDAVATGFHIRAETQLADLAGVNFRFDETARQWLPVVDPDGRAGNRVYIAGDCARIGGADSAETAGRLVGQAILDDLGIPGTATRSAPALRARLRRLEKFQAGITAGFPFPTWLASEAADDTIVCRCEVITVGDLKKVVGTGGGALEVNRAKAFSRVGMGRCQGRFCGLAAAEIMSDCLHININEVGRLRAQAPVKPLGIDNRS